MFGDSGTRSVNLVVTPDCAAMTECTIYIMLCFILRCSALSLMLPPRHAASCQPSSSPFCPPVRESREGRLRSLLRTDCLSPFSPVSVSMQSAGQRSFPARTRLTPATALATQEAE